VTCVNLRLRRTLTYLLTYGTYLSSIPIQTTCTVSTEY